MMQIIHIFSQKFMNFCPPDSRFLLYSPPIGENVFVPRYSDVCAITIVNIYSHKDTLLLFDNSFIG